MKVNPGGHIDPPDVVGRDALIRQLWGILERQSVVLSAERRIGKTCIIKKMIAENSDGKLLVYRDLESVHAPVEFVKSVFHDVRARLSRLNKVMERARQFMEELGGVEFSGIVKMPNKMLTRHWKTLLTKTIEDLVEHQDHTVILFWDEVPLMLDNIKKRNGEDTAMEMLDTLRSLRQDAPGIAHGLYRLAWSAQRHYVPQAGGVFQHPHK